MFQSIFGGKKAREPQDDCEGFMDEYLKCVNGMKQGLSEVEGECLEQKDLYRKCVKAARNNKAKKEEVKR